MQSHLNKLALVAAVLVIVGVVTPLVVLKPWQQPSREMVLLRKVEQQASLPKPNNQLESDRGTFKDRQGATHHERRITNFYVNAQSVTQAREMMRTKGWATKATVKVDAKTSLVMVNMTDRSCAELRTSTLNNEQDDDGLTNRVVLMSQDDDGCSGYLDQ